MSLRVTRWFPLPSGDVRLVTEQTCSKCKIPFAEQCKHLLCKFIDEESECDSDDIWEYRYHTTIFEHVHKHTIIDKVIELYNLLFKSDLFVQLNRDIIYKIIVHALPQPIAYRKCMIIQFCCCNTIIHERCIPGYGDLCPFCGITAEIKEIDTRRYGVIKLSDSL